MRSVVRWLAAGLVACTAPSPNNDDGQDLVEDTSDSGPVTETGDTDPPAIEAEVTLDAVEVLCADPDARAEAPFDGRNARDTRNEGVEYNLMGSGLAIADFTGDGRLDTFVITNMRWGMWKQDADGQFVEVTDSHLPVDGPSTQIIGVSAADVDGDADLDVFLTRTAADNALLINDGSGVFSVANASGIDGSLNKSVASSWGDMDGDGDLDLFVSDYGPNVEDPFAEIGDFEVGTPSYLYENAGNGLFIDRSERLPPQVHDAFVFMGAWIDLGGGPLPELLTVHDFGWARPSQLFWNHNGDLVRDDGSAGWNISFAGMGLGIGDVNNDGEPDFVQSSWRKLSLLESAVSSGGGNNTWWETSHLKGLAPNLEADVFQEFGWGTELVDIDLDGDLDIVIAHGEWTAFNDDLTPEKDALWIQDDDGQFTDEAAAWKVDDGAIGRGLVVADLNGDGWPDMMKNPLNLPAKMYLSRCGDGSWSKVRLHNTGGNPFAVGAKVQVTVAGRTWTRWITAGSTSMFSGGPPEALFGLDGASTIDHIDVTWPDGATSQVADVSVNHVLDIWRTP